MTKPWFWGLLIFAACGSADRLKGSLAPCDTDQACEVGELCAGDSKKCVRVDPEDLASWPKPTGSLELLTRLGPLVFVQPVASTSDAPALLSIDMTVLDEQRVTLRHALSAGTVRARVEGDQLRLWSLRLAADGGGVSIPSASDPSGATVAVYVTNIKLEGLGEALGTLVVEDYPKARMSAAMAIRLSADVGGDPERLARVELDFENVTISCQFDLDGNVLTAALDFSGSWQVEGSAELFRIDALAVSTRFGGAAVPEHWGR